MLFERSRSTGSLINWPGGKPRDRPDIPDHAVPLLKAAGLTARMGDNVYEIVDSYGNALQLPFGCALGDWAVAIDQLKGQNHGG